MRGQDKIHYVFPNRSPSAPSLTAAPQNNTLSVDVLVHAPKSPKNQNLELMKFLTFLEILLPTKVLLENVL